MKGKTIICFILAANIFAVIFVALRTTPAPKQTMLIETQVSQPQIETSQTTKEEELKFSDPLLAYLVLKKLDVFEPVATSYFNVFMTPKSYYKAPYLALKTNDNYCDIHRAYFVDHPDFIFEKNNVLLDYAPNALVRSKVVPKIGKDIQKMVSAALPKKIKTKRILDLKPDINVFFTNGALYLYQHVGKHFSCLSQSSNHVPGHGILNRKDFVAESVVRYAKEYETRPQCFNFDKFFPKTWVLYHKDQCEAFFKEFNSPEYQRLKNERRLVYIRKVGFGSHKAKGVQPVNEKEEAELRSMYENGQKCGIVKKNYIMQTFVYNPLLLDGHKFDFRIYMVIGSTNPTTLYYHDGFLRVSLHDYDTQSDDKSVLLTNTDLAMKTLKNAAGGELINGMNETELRNFQMWNFDRLQAYLLEKRIIKDKNWLDNYLRPEFKRAMIHLVKMSEHAFLKSSSVYELFGVDFMLDENLNLWFLECNSGPVLKGTSEEKEKFLVKMLSDQFEIVQGFTRSRIKRVIKFVNNLIEHGGASWVGTDEILMPDLEQNRLEFKQITRNYFEPEFEPGADSSFSKIIDGNLKGAARYMGYIDEKCI